MKITPIPPFHPLIQSWFTTDIDEPTDIQSKAWPEIVAGRLVLVTSPTGSGKTPTTFLRAIHQLVSGEFPPHLDDGLQGAWFIRDRFRLSEWDSLLCPPPRSPIAAIC